jgi:hypothetical protein
MHEISQNIFNILSNTKNRWLPMRDLEIALGLKERGLQGIKGKPGLLDVAIDEVFQETGFVIITVTGRSGGIRMTNDIDQIRYAKARLRAHTMNEQKRVDLWERIERIIKIKRDNKTCKNSIQERLSI